MLTRLELRNFKCFESLELHISPLTLLCGLNGMGKSSVIQALLLLRQSHITGELDEGLVLGGDLVDLGTGQDVLFEDATSETIEFSLQHSDVPEVLRLGYEYSKDGNRLGAVHRGVGFTDHGSHLRETPANQRAPRVSCLPSLRHRRQWDDLPPLGGRVLYVNAERIGPRKIHQHSEVMARHGKIGTRGEFALNYLASTQDQLMPERDPRCECTPSRRLFDIVEHWLQEVSPGAHLKLETVPDADAIIAGFSFARHGDVDTRRYRSTNVGFGLSYIIPVLIALLEPKGSLCLIENPEAHLHPRGQTKLAELAVRASLAGVQVIVETHSDHFLDGVRIAVRNEITVPDRVAIHYFQRVGTRAEVSSPTVDANGRLSSWPEGFFDQHEENLSRLLAPRT